MTKHPHYEVMMEWAADTTKIVQYRRHSSSEWKDERGAPDFSGFGEYRIKPDPKPDQVFQFIVELRNSFPRIRITEHWERPNISITFDGEDKLKEVISI